MTTAYEEILQILADIEKENNIPKNTLKKIYELEVRFTHLRNREQINDDLQRIVSNAALGKAN